MVKSIDANAAWRALFEEYDIVRKVREDGKFEITADMIRKYKEPRLMAKWDSIDSLPKILKDANLNILPISNSAYVLSDMELYCNLPKGQLTVKRMFPDVLCRLESINFNEITSEAIAIKALFLTGILDDFLDAGETVETFNGRMRSGDFSFKVRRSSGEMLPVSVSGAQLEIDGGFENDDAVIILEAKNVPHPDFHIRQLYYPLRLWSKKVKKPIRLIFSQYCNMIFRLFEYTFDTLEEYSSVRLLSQKGYSLQNTKITSNDLYRVYDSTKPIFDDRAQACAIPFPQANSIDKVIALMDFVGLETKTKEEIALFLDFDVRQSDYYTNAGRYLEIFKLGKAPVELSLVGKRILRMSYKDRQLAIVHQILKHRIFHHFFETMYLSGQEPSSSEVQEYMKEYQVCSGSLVNRRASSVKSWLRWIFSLVASY